MKFKKLAGAICIVGICAGFNAQAQNQDVDLYDLSLEELMNMEIVSASKKAEDIFSAPLSSTVITYEEIVRSGATSIPEALRLAPGLIVREQTNGNYDIHLRGFDNTPPGNTMPFSTNTITLVMINNRVVYNYFNGGTFWETLPVDINDVAKIEIVRGPSSPLYGPNAASGVINIITKTYNDKEGLIAQGSAQGGSRNTYIANANLGYNFGEGLSAAVTANMQQRNRQNTHYYNLTDGAYVDSPEGISSPAYSAPASEDSVKNALDRIGVNGFINYQQENLEVGLSGGYQQSLAQKVFMDAGAPVLTTSFSETLYGDLKMKYKKLLGQFSYNGGDQNAAVGVPNGDYSFKTFDALVEYDFEPLKNLRVRPGVNYRSAVYDGYMIGGENEIATMAGALYLDYTPIEKLRLVAAGRADKYNLTDNAIPSYEFAATYQLTPKFLLRGVTSRSHRAPFILDSYMSLVIPNGPFNQTRIIGNQDLEQMQINMHELGLRFKPMANLMLDLEAYTAKAENYDAVGMVGMENVDGVMVRTLQYNNLPLQATLTGVTLGVNYVASEKLQVKGSVSAQQTKLEDAMVVTAGPGGPPTISYEDMNHEATPSFYGNLYVNYQPIKRLSLNASTYFMSEQSFHHSRRTDELKGHINLNLNTNFMVNDHISLFVTGRNLVGERTREFAFADDAGRYLLGGFRIKL